ncbi:MAG: FAD:protein FMN transferase [Oscillibacter sp.]|jgi:thiamine biosynthesis lipoprotein|nr:FAD:protein FMN transferase [Oscillibacter sp.]
MKRILALFLCAAALTGLAGCGTRQSSAELFAMDTVMELTACGKNGEAALDASKKEITRLEALLSRTRADSEISLLNRSAGKPAAVSAEVGQLLLEARAYSAATGGAFDVTVAPVVSAWGFTADAYRVPSQAELSALLTRVDSSKIGVELTASGAQVLLGAGQSVDLGGIAKGYASDRVAAVFEDAGVTSGMISLGGNVYVRGKKPDGSAWRVAIQDPKNSSGYVGVLKLTDAFAVTSGGYQRYFEQDGKRYHHIIDPATGYPAESGLTSVTVVASANDAEGSVGGSGTMCDAFSTALFVMGAEKAVEFWRSGGYSFDLVLVTDDGRVLITDGLSDGFSQEKGAGYSYETIRKTAS